MAGYWLYGERLPSVLARAADSAATRVRGAAVSTRERLEAGPMGDVASDSATVRRGQKATEETAPTASPRAGAGDSLRWVTLNGEDTRASSSRAAAPLVPLTRRNGPAYVTLTAAQAAAVLSPILSRQLPASTAHLALALVRDEMHLRGDVQLAELAGSATGSSSGSSASDGVLRRIIGATLDRRDTLLLVGTLEPVREGLAQFRVQEVRLRGIDVPARAIPALVGTIRREAARAAGNRSRAAGLTAADTLAADALPVPLPASIADVRVANGRLTLYKAVRP